MLLGLSLHVLRCYTPAPQHPPISAKSISPVVVIIFCFIAAGLRQRDTLRHSAVSPQAALVGAELSRPVGVRCIESRCSCHPATAPMAGANRVQTRCLCVQCLHGTAAPYLAGELHRSADSEVRRRLRSASSASLTVRRTRLSTVDDRTFPVAGPRVYGTLCHSMSLPLSHFLVSAIARRLVSSQIASPNVRRLRSAAQ